MEKLAINIGDSFASPFGRPLTAGSLFSTIITNGIYIAAVILIGLIVAAGYGFISGAGSNDPQRAAQAKKALTMAVVGFVIIFSVYWIAQIIGMITGTGTP